MSEAIIITSIICLTLYLIFHKISKAIYALSHSEHKDFVFEVLLFKTTGIRLSTVKKEEEKKTDTVSNDMESELNSEPEQ